MALRRRAATEGPSAGDYELHDTLASLAMGTGSLLLPQYFAKAGTTRKALIGAAILASAAKAPAAAIATGGLALTTAWAESTTGTRLLRHSGRHSNRGDGRLALAAAVLGWDLIYYWNHRFMHEWRFMWAIHVVHHSSERYNLSTALRQTWTDVAGTFVPYGLLSLLGIRPALIGQARGINLLYQFWIHTEMINRLGPLERVLNTPSHHRVHHGSNPQYLDRNYGSILIVWDRLFGSFEPEVEPVVYGLTKNIKTFNPVRIAFAEHLAILRDVAQAPTWSERLQLIARGPGWADRWRQTSAAARSRARRSYA